MKSTLSTFALVAGIFLSINTAIEVLTPEPKCSCPDFSKYSTTDTSTDGYLHPKFVVDLYCKRHGHIIVY